MTEQPEKRKVKIRTGKPRNSRKPKNPKMDAVLNIVFGLMIMALGLAILYLTTETVQLGGILLFGMMGVGGSFVVRGLIQLYGTGDDKDV